MRAQLEDKEIISRSLETLNDGMKVLREYIILSNLNFLEICQKYDKVKSGSIPERFLKEIILSELKVTPFYFTDDDFAQIVEQAPINISTKYIEYQKLSDLLGIYDHQNQVNGPKPQNSYHIYRNKIIKQEKGYNKSSQKVFNEDIAKMFKADTANFFDRSVFFDFRSFELQRLDINLLSYRHRNMDFDDNIQEKIAQFHKLNNETILDNFQIIIAQNFAQNALPQSSSEYILEEKIEIAISDYLGLKRGQKIFPYMLRDEFINIVHLKVPQLEFTSDEMDLLFWLIWQREDFGEISLRSISRWVLSFRAKKVRDLIKVPAYNGEYSKDRYHVQIEQPKIFKELVKVSKIYGIKFIEYALSPYINQEKKVEFENFRILLRGLEIGFNLTEMNEFQYYCANLGLLVMKEIKIGQSKVQIDLQKFIFNLKKNLSELYPHEQQVEQQQLNQNSDETLPPHDRAFIRMVQQIMQTFLAKIQSKLRVYQDDDQMVDELKLRMVLSEEVAYMDHDNLDHILQNLHSKTDQKYSTTVKKFYLSEIYSVFEQHLITSIGLQKNKTNTYDTHSKYLNPSKTDQYKFNPNGKVNDQTQSLINQDLSMGKFINSSNKAFVVEQLDDRKTMEKLRVNLEQNFMNVEQIKYHSLHERCELACDGFYKQLQKFDSQGVGFIEKNLFINILQQMFDNLDLQETFQIIDFAMNVSKVTDDSNIEKQLISYPFLCLQLCEYYQIALLEYPDVSQARLNNMNSNFIK